MKNPNFRELFVNELEDMYSSENQIVEALPKLIKLVSLPELKEALSNHLKETQKQVDRIEKIFAILGISPNEKRCMGMEGILNEANDMIKNLTKSPTLDAAIISAAQKVEHYEIASYGTLRSFAQQLDLDYQIANLLQETLDEEGAADKKLTKLAEGSFFSSGVNKEAVTANNYKRR